MRIFKTLFVLLGVAFFVDAYANFYDPQHSVWLELSFALACFGCAGLLWLVEIWGDR